MADDERMNVAIDVDARALNAALDQLEVRAKSFGAALTGALKGAVVEGRSLDEVLRSLALRLSDRLVNASLKPLEGLLDGAMGGLLGGGAVRSILPFAEGGVVGGPTLFPLGRDVGLMGEAGAEAILPLSRGPDGRLGVSAGAAGASAPVVFNVTTPDADSFRKSEAQVTAMLARAVGRGRRGL